MPASQECASTVALIPGPDRLQIMMKSSMTGIIITHISILRPSSHRERPAGFCLQSSCCICHAQSPRVCGVPRAAPRRASQITVVSHRLRPCLSPYQMGSPRASVDGMMRWDSSSHPAVHSSLSHGQPWGHVGPRGPPSPLTPAKGKKNSKTQNTGKRRNGLDGSCPRCSRDWTTFGRLTRVS